MEKINDGQSGFKNVVIITGVAVTIGATGYFVYNLFEKVSNNKLINIKKNELKKKKIDLLKELEDLKTPLENMDKITSMKLQELMDSLSSDTFKPIDVIQAYQLKALLMDKEYNFITDLNPYIKEDLLNSEHSKKGQLKGIPISIKECFKMKGCYCTHGMLDSCIIPSEFDEVIIHTIKMLGMIPFVTTNMCQTGFSIESSNPIFGETLNPHNKSRTSGGSSGGEGAILASGASLLGLGSDIGGSIRIPSSYCGIFGLKPTSQRLSHRHEKNFFAHQNLINVSLGPMARSMEDLVLFFKTIACGDLYHLDPYCPPLCFNDKVFEKKRPLKIGYYVHLGENQVTPSPSVVRAVELAKKALESAGHNVFAFTIPDIDYAIFELYFSTLFTDGGTGFLKHYIKNNPVDPSISFTTMILKIPNFMKYFVSMLLKPFNRNYAVVLNAIKGKRSVYSLWELNDKIKAYKELVLTKWQEAKLDGIICPVLPNCALPLRTSGYILDVIGYTAIYNLLDYPAGSVPVTTVNQQDIDELIKSYPTNTPTHRKLLEYQKESLGMPIGVQCVSMLWREETCLRIMKDITLHL